MHEYGRFHSPHHPPSLPPSLPPFCLPSSIPSLGQARPHHRRTFRHWSLSGRQGAGRRSWTGRREGGREGGRKGGREGHLSGDALFSLALESVNSHPSLPPSLPPPLPRSCVGRARPVPGNGEFGAAYCRRCDWDCPLDVRGRKEGGREGGKEG